MVFTRCRITFGRRGEHLAPSAPPGKPCCCVRPRRPATSSPNHPTFRREHSVHGGQSIRLSHAGPHQGLRHGQEGLGQRPSVLLPRRQDRRARRQRRRQVDAAAHHGGHRHGIHRRRVRGRGRPRRLPAAGAAARRDAERARQRHAGRRGQAGHPRPLQRTRHELFRRDRGRDDQPAGRDRGPGPVGSRFAGRTGDGSPRLPAGRLGRVKALGRRTPPRRPVQAAARKARDAAARRAHQPPRRRDGELARRASQELPRAPS